MDITSYLCRAIYKEHSEAGFDGTYKLMIDAKSMPSPTSAPNTVECTTFEDASQRFKMGIKTSDIKEFIGNYEKDIFEELLEMEGKECDIIQLWGEDGLGSEAKSAYVGQITPTINDVGGVDEIVEMTASVVQNTVPVWCTDKLTVVDNGDKTFTVTKKS